MSSTGSTTLWAVLTALLAQLHPRKVFGRHVLLSYDIGLLDRQLCVTSRHCWISLLTVDLGVQI
jgi:hypothetical protein